MHTRSGERKVIAGAVSATASFVQLEEEFSHTVLHSKKKAPAAPARPVAPAPAPAPVRVSATVVCPFVTVFI